MDAIWGDEVPNALGKAIASQDPFHERSNRLLVSLWKAEHFQFVIDQKSPHTVGKRSNLGATNHENQGNRK